VELGVTPSDAIIAATSRPAELLGLNDLGTLATGKSASFIVLEANPLENIKNMRRIDSVYLGGEKLPREKMLTEFTRAGK
jgi:imidazolonepropionase-like amidohydrolase